MKNTKKAISLLGLALLAFSTMQFYAQQEEAAEPTKTHLESLKEQALALASFEAVANALSMTKKEFFERADVPIKLTIPLSVLVAMADVGRRMKMLKNAAPIGLFLAGILNTLFTAAVRLEKEAEKKLQSDNPKEQKEGAVLASQAQQLLNDSQGALDDSKEL